MMPLLSLLPGLMELGKEFIIDKDKQIEFAYKTQELAFKSMEAMLSAKTNPWVDGFVKIMYAMQVMWRPLVGGCMTLFGAYCHFKGIDIGETSQIIFDGAFPAWGVSRHVEKQNKAKKKPVWDEDDDD